jgi:hypothetical protein
MKAFKPVALLAGYEEAQSIRQTTQYIPPRRSRANAGDGLSL